MRRAVAAALCAATTLAASAASASVFEMFGAGPRAVGMAGAMTAAASGGEAAFHNPAMLAGSVLAGAWGGFDMTHYDLTISLARPVCTDATATCRSAFPGGFSSRAAQLPRDTSGVQLGWHYPLGGIFKERVVLGAGLAFDALGPMGGFLSLSVLFTLCAPIYLLAARHFTSEKLEHVDAAPED